MDESSREGRMRNYLGNRPTPATKDPRIFITVQQEVDGQTISSTTEVSFSFYSRGVVKLSSIMISIIDDLLAEISQKLQYYFSTGNRV